MDQYNFTKSFQDQILAVMLKDHEIISNVKGIIQLAYFGEPVLQKIVSDLLQFANGFIAMASQDEFTHACLFSRIHGGVN